MARVTVEDSLKITNNRFILVQMVIKRVKQLVKEAQPLIDNKDDNKSIVLALREIAAGKIPYTVIPYDKKK
ncbi:MAG: DNA-directed RNA polymerase subunit omega [Deltaproteobacteria bacterium]|nr:DNA-directed RNA polymerase subunit omega [Deltaproteobacteria bacterium]MCL5791836.1 DNA-directed RNA polymerase subunit omega [Deltaproteobacteria bacterium]